MSTEAAGRAVQAAAAAAPEWGAAASAVDHAQVLAAAADLLRERSADIGTDVKLT